MGAHFPKKDEQEDEEPPEGYYLDWHERYWAGFFKNLDACAGRLNKRKRWPFEKNGQIMFQLRCRPILLRSGWHRAGPQSARA